MFSVVSWASLAQGVLIIDRLLIGLVLAVGLYAADDLAVSTVLPAVSAELLGDGLYGASFVAFLLANLASLVATGYFIDRIGVARPFAVGIALFGAGLVLAIVAPAMAVFVLGRGLQGLGGGAIQAVVNAAITLAWRDAARQRAISWVTTAWMVPALAGPGLTGWITEMSNWRYVFGLLAVLALITAVLVFPLLRRLARPEAGVDDSAAPLPTPSAAVRDAVIIALAMGGVVGGLARADIFGALIVALSMLAGWRAHAASLPLKFWRGGSPLGAVLLLRFLAFAIFFGIEAWLPWTTNRSALASPVLAGLILSGAAGGWTSATWWVDSAIERLGSLRILQRASALFVFSTLLTWYALIELRSLSLLFLAWALAGLAMGMIYPVTSTLAMARVERGREGQLSMMSGLADTLGITWSIGIGSALLRADQPGALARVGPLWLGLVALSLLLPILLLWRRRYFASAGNRDGAGV